MKVVVGLGNPGTRYRHARHNLGFMVVDELARRHGIDTGREKFHAWVGTGEIGGHKVLLAKPTTFMNRSGRAVIALGRFYKLDLGEVLVVADDLALPLGRLRIRAQGSAGGHNGLKDIIDCLGNDEFPRLRMGIDSPQYDATGHVLGDFSDEEMPTVDEAIARSADAATCWIQEGVDSAMNLYNRGSQDSGNKDEDAESE